jgi:cellulose synthase/poly-beta-1,6-N-acetylglucosamine synthase-like glycosyltransferase
MLTIFFWLAVLTVVYTYFIYPLLLLLLTAGKREVEYASFAEWPVVSLIIAAHNEEAVLREKLENSIALDYPEKQLEIIVASDGSTDATEEIVRFFAARGVRLHQVRERGGKTQAQNEAVRLASGQFLVFSDANSMYEQQALKNLLRPFTDENIGCVCGELRYANPEGDAAGKGEGVYWRYEQFLKGRESTLSSTLGANGSIYALRRELFEELSADIISDFIMPLRVWCRGFRVVYEPSAVAEEQSGGTFSDEFRRRTRIIARSLHGLWTERGVLNPFVHGFFAFQMFSHKLLRWIVPLALVVALVSNALLLADELYRVLFALQLGVYGMALLGTLLASSLGRFALFYVPAHFCAINAGALLGLFSFVSGRRYRTWKPTSRS